MYFVGKGKRYSDFPKKKQNNFKFEACNLGQNKQRVKCGQKCG